MTTIQRVTSRTCEECGASFGRTANEGRQPEAWVRFHLRRYCSHECSRGNRPGWTVEQRFMAKVRVSDAGCWLWQASINNRGYGVFMRKFGHPAYAHRWSYEHYVGPIPDGLEIDHLCRVTNCCRPDHLEAVTAAENMRRAVAARGPRQPRAPRPNRVYPRRQSCDHEMTPENTLTCKNGMRWCRMCREAIYARMRKS